MVKGIVENGWGVYLPTCLRGRGESFRKGAATPPLKDRGQSDSRKTKGKQAKSQITEKRAEGEPNSS